MQYSECTEDIVEQFHVINAHSSTPLYETVINNETFVLPQTYDMKEIAARGPYCTVCFGLDNREDLPVSVKKTKNMFSIGGKPNVLITKRVLRELKILEHLKHPNIASLREVVIPDSFEDFRDMYMIVDTMDTDLREVIRSKECLSDEHVQYIMFQLCAGLKYIHEACIIHRDIRPQNILISSDARIKISNFGVAKCMDQNASSSKLQVTNGSYSAPEMLLNSGRITKAVDMWSAGCILAELLNGETLFCGKSPTKSFITIVNLLNNDEDYLEAEFNGCSPLALDLLRKMLEIDPEKRITAANALQHPYFQNFYDAYYDDLVNVPIEPFDNEVEVFLTDILSIKIEAYATILRYNGYNLELHRCPTRPLSNTSFMDGFFKKRTTAQ